MRIFPVLLAGLLTLGVSASPHDGTAQEGGADQQGEPILPDEDDLRALGDFAERMMRDFKERMEPMAESLRELMDDLDAYEAPERLPNGDIIIRRKQETDPPEAEDSAPSPEGAIDL